MKRCPTCSRTYDDISLRFCLDDGTELVNKLPEGGAPETRYLQASAEAQATVRVPPSPVPSPPPQLATRQRRRLWPWLVAAAALLFIAITIAAVAVFLTHVKKPLVHHLVMRIESDAAKRDDLTNTAAAVIKKRLEAVGVGSFEVKRGTPNSGELLVDLPRLDDPERVKQIITTLGKLEFVHVVSPASPAPVQTYRTEDEAYVAFKNSERIITGRVLAYSDESANPNRKKEWVIVEYPAIIEGSDLRNVAVVGSTVGDNYEIQFSLKKAAAQLLATWSGAHINEYLGIALNDEVKSIAYIKSQISDRGVITGRYTKQSANDLALVLNAGALPAPVKIISEKIDN